jgi:uncharacterized membrane protein
VGGRTAIVLKQELRKGISETVPFLLSHHIPSRRNRCHRIVLFGRQIHLCARCSGIYPGILAGLLFPLHPISLWLIAVLPAPALVDWAITSFRSYHDSNAVRTATGLLLGYGYGLGVTRLLAARDLSVVALGVVYGLVAAAPLYKRRTSVG